MDFRTIVDIPKPGFLIEPCEEMLFVGSCFADSIGRRFAEEQFRATVNPFGVMYNPASILHTIERLTVSTGLQSVNTVFLTLGTNHVYIEKATGKIVDNCEKRPAFLFQEKLLTVDECADYLQQAIDLLRQQNPQVHIVLTVSPIRYRKYGYHESQLSKATLLLAVDRIVGGSRDSINSIDSGDSQVIYFPAYEIVMDELRDYRFYKPDMLHPSDQAVDYIWQQLSDTYLSPRAKQFLKEWAPLKAALGHRPFNPDSQEYHDFLASTQAKVEALLTKYRSSF